MESVLTPAVITFFVFLAAHWGSKEAFGELGKLVSYVVGTALISIIYGVWCLEQRAPISALWGFQVHASIVIAAGLGTLTSHFIDSHFGLRRENRLLRRRLGDGESEPEGPRDH
jgi:hypothetical protein